jgi:hypothetical protein
MLRMLILLALGTAVADAAPQHCLDEPGKKVILDETLIGVANPDAAENQLKLAMCWPLFEQPGLLFDYTNLEAGLTNYLSPIYMQQGIFVAVTPLSLIVLRVEAAGVQYWPLPIDGAGYYSVLSYDADYRDSALPASRAQAATGVEAGGSTTLQGELALSSRVALAATDTLSAEYWAVGSDAFWVNQRRDVILAHNDWLVKNTAAILVALEHGRATVHVGIFDDLTIVPRAGYVANIVGGLAMIDFRHVTASLHEMSAFITIGDYTEHAFRGGATALLGVSGVWEY